MEAPDKLYLNRTTGSPRLNGKVHPYKPTKIRDDDKIIEYIRKDIVDDMLKTAEDHAFLAGADWQKVQKPSQELLEALHTAAYLDEMEFYGGLKDKLRELYEQLNKLI